MMSDSPAALQTPFEQCPLTSSGSPTATPAPWVGRPIDLLTSMVASMGAVRRWHARRHFESVKILKGP